MSKFLSDCQIFFKICGYCFYDNKSSGRPRRANAINIILTILLFHVVFAAIAFICDSAQPRDERLLLIMTMIAYLEIFGGHFTLTLQKSEISDFFDHFEMVVNQGE